MGNLALCNLLIDIFEIVVTYSQLIDDETFKEIQQIKDEIVEFKKKLKNKNYKETQTFVNKQKLAISLYKKVLNSENNHFLGADMLKIQKILNYHIKDN